MGINNLNCLWVIFIYASWNHFWYSIVRHYSILNYTALKCFKLSLYTYYIYRNCKLNKYFFPQTAVGITGELIQVSQMMQMWMWFSTLSRYVCVWCYQIFAKALWHIVHSTRHAISVIINSSLLIVYKMRHLHHIIDFLCYSIQSLHRLKNVLHIFELCSCLPDLFGEVVAVLIWNLLSNSWSNNETFFYRQLYWP